MNPKETAAERFAERFGGPPEAVAFAPGRVNLIGEHLDYCGLPVLPAALSRGVALAFRSRRDGRVRCRSTEPGCGEAAFALGGPVPSDGFGRYLGAAGAALGAGGWTSAKPRGFDGFIASDLPAASGLSSSSALVVAAALALLATDRRLGPGGTLVPEEARRLALDLAAAERGVAIQGGAMDQSVCLGAAAGNALSLSFEPPGWRQVPVNPERFSFLVAFSGRRADKGGAAGAVFDRRVGEAREALGRAQRVLGDPGGYPALVARHAAAELVAAARRLPPPLDGRFRHLVTEADRTRRAVRCLLEGDAAGLGALLDASHESLRADYEVSTPELDALVGEARDAGALGARLTGAGLGGSVVILATPADRAGIRARLRRRFYAPRGIPEPDRLHLLDGTPSVGAALLPADATAAAAR